ncbi:hypothetical protein [Chondromyces crocatus]|uniref:Uncharacterized protein n=1 Tax=Chondromyces crocatus TaxID=52 RepID=A0A0K1EFZ6_CHOCO|nr:hypothetical protein [Chondromyces crocatus]AKT39795.1 uncharacterized protein CMC5_039460 [Chondromyces crocatus]
MSTFPIHHLEAKLERCRVRIRINEVPAVEMSAAGEQPEWFAPPINLYLVGRGNRIDVDVWPLEREDGSYETFEAVEFHGAVRVYGKGDAVAPGEGPLLVDLPVMTELVQRREAAAERDEELPIPQRFSLAFDNEGPDFSAELLDAPALPDDDALRDYAVLLRDRMRAGDVRALVDEMGPKVRAYAQAYDEAAVTLEKSLLSVLRDDYAPRGFMTDFERDDVVIVPNAARTLCELQRPEGLPLIQTPPDAEGGTLQIAVVAGVREGALRVVR